ncbi:MAG: chemotaxis protein [Lachnospiraceae bacterium]|nr:chemotaxis protein [Lachnospiraceae bacterium]
MDTNILLESGTNELEILEFKVSGNYYGINVAKVKEIMKYQSLTPIPNGHPNLEGAFNTRGETISIINLAKCLGMKEENDPDKDMFLLTGFNNLSSGFHVNEVVGIHRVNWSQIIKPDSMISNSKSSVTTGIINIDGKLVILLDFEKIVADISPEVGIKLSEIDQLGERSINDAPIIYAEDSQLLSTLIYDGLTKAGYTRIMPTNNGLELWEILQSYKKAGTLKENVACVVTDIEMPQMDGHRLLKLIKNDPELKDIPVIIFSSLINDDMKRKGESLGADAQLSKNDMGEFIKKLDEILKEKIA